MSQLAKLSIKSVTRSSNQDHTQQRRQKLAAAIGEQQAVAEAAMNGESYEVQRKTWAKSEQGEKVLVERIRKVRTWFFEQDGGWYVQCKYGNKALALGKGNAVFVKALKDVGAVFETLKAAAEVGELDDAIAETAKRKAV